MTPTQPPPQPQPSPQLMAASLSSPIADTQWNMAGKKLPARPWRHHIHGVERESNGKSRMSLSPPHEPEQQGKDAGAQGRSGPGTTSKSLSSCLSTRRTVKNWPYFNQFPQLRPCLAPISVNSLSSNRKNRRWAGGVLGQRGHRKLARVALLA